MRLNQWMTLISTGLMFISNSVFAAAQPTYEQLQIPHCLAEKIKFQHQILAENQQFKIIDLQSDQIEQLAQLADQAQCGRFVNVSHKLSGTLLPEKKNSAQQLLQQAQVKKGHPSRFLETAYEIRHQDEVNQLLKEVVPDNIWQTLNSMTSFHNRSATKETGVQTAQWLKSKFEEMAIANGRNDTAAFFVNTGWYKQPSLVTVIGKDIKAPAVVIGAHMDTLDGFMPGAGDDGSGSASIMEMARVLLSSKTNFKRPVYVIWYAAEERGLVGSQYVVKHFREHNIPVKAVVQFDMTGYRVDAKDPTMWIYTDYTNKKLNQFISQLINTYVHVPVDYSRCGYGCSDHASWTEDGIPAAFPCESNFEDHNPYIHSSSDTMDLLSLDHMTNFTKLAVAFAVELGSE